MNNKYGYRLVDILKRGRGRKSLRPASLGDRSEKEIKADRRNGGQGIVSRCISILQLRDGIAARPRVAPHR